MFQNILLSSKESFYACFYFLAVLCLFYKVNPRVILFGSTLSSCRDLDWNCVGSVISLGTTGGGAVTKF